MQSISTSTTSRVAWTTLEKTYASPSHHWIMTHRQNIANPQQGNQTITDYIQDVKRNIDSLAHINVFVDFDELSIRVLNGLGPVYSNISHALQARDTPLNFEEFFEHLLSYVAQLQILVPSISPHPASTSASALFTSTSPSSHRQSNNHGGWTHNRSPQSWTSPTTHLKKYRPTPPPLSPQHPAPSLQLKQSRYLGHCQICGKIGHSV